MANPLDRTWYNGLVDDDGSGTTGTIWNKAAVDGLMDSVDASLAGVVPTSAVGTTVVANPSPVDIVIAKSIPRLEMQFTGSTTKARAFAAVADWAGFGINANYNAGAWSRDDAAKPGFTVVASVTGGITIQRLDGAGNLAVLTLDPNGVLSLPVSGAIKFPAVQIPNADPTTIDDYREGVWSPTVIGVGGSSGTTYVYQRGAYLKFGRYQIATFDVALATVGTMTGNLAIGNFPYSTDTVAYILQHCHVDWNALATAMVGMSGQLEASAPTSVRLLGRTGASTSSISRPLTSADLTAASSFHGVMIYRGNG